MRCIPAITAIECCPGSIEGTILKPDMSDLKFAVTGGGHGGYDNASGIDWAAGTQPRCVVFD